MLKVPAIPMIRILAQYANAHKLPFDIRRWESIQLVYSKYINSKPIN